MDEVLAIGDRNCETFCILLSLGLLSGSNYNLPHKDACDFYDSSIIPLYCKGCKCEISLKVLRLCLRLCFRFISLCTFFCRWMILQFACLKGMVWRKKLRITSHHTDLTMLSILLMPAKCKMTVLANLSFALFVLDSGLVWKVEWMFKSFLLCGYILHI